MYFTASHFINQLTWRWDEDQFQIMEGGHTSDFMGQQNVDVLSSPNHNRNDGLASMFFSGEGTTTSTTESSSLEGRKSVLFKVEMLNDCKEEEEERNNEDPSSRNRQGNAPRSRTKAPKVLFLYLKCPDLSHEFALSIQKRATR